MLRGNFRQHFAERLDFVRIAIAEYEFVPCLALLFAALENAFVVHRHRGQEDDPALGKRFPERLRWQRQATTPMQLTATCSFCFPFFVMDSIIAKLSIHSNIQKNDVGVAFFYLMHTVRGGMMTE